MEVKMRLPLLSRSSTSALSGLIAAITGRSMDWGEGEHVRAGRAVQIHAS
jgi:hypothetical protein